MESSQGRNADLFEGADPAGFGTPRVRPDQLRPAWQPGSRVLIGTSGYSFADWVGPFYPRGFSSRDMLPYYSHHFPVVEVNSTYYRIPPARTLAQMERRTPPGFRFIVKVHQVLTHERRIDPGSITAFRGCLEPLLAAGKLDGLLAQFPWSFKNDSWGRRYLVAMRRELPDAPLFTEFRHASWATDDTWRLLGDHRLGFCVVDEPELHGLMPPVVELTSPLGYVRFHGRNAKQWWGQGGGDRYDYLYSESELREWVPRIQDLAQRAEKVYVFFNNCHGGQAAANAQLMHKLLSEASVL